MTSITQRPGGFSYQRMTNVSPATWQVFSPAGRVAALTYSARDAERVADALGYQHPPAAEGVQAGEVADAEVWLFKGTDGAWHTFHNEQHRLDTIADGRWEVRKFAALTGERNG